MEEGILDLRVRLGGKMAEMFLQIKEHMGLRNDTEILRSLISHYWREHREELEPRLKHFNLNEQGVMILDRDLDRLVQVYFKPEGVVCEHCGGGGCRHVEFALSLPEVQRILWEKGWKPRTRGES